MLFPFAVASVLELISKALLLLPSSKAPDSSGRNATAELQSDRLIQPASSFQFEVDILPNVDPAFRGIEWTKDEKLNLEMFEAGFERSRFHSIAEMIDSVAPSCDAILPKSERVDASSIDAMIWSNDKQRKGFAHEATKLFWDC